MQTNPKPKYGNGARVGLTIAILVIATLVYAFLGDNDRDAKVEKANHELHLEADSTPAKHKKILDDLNRRVGPPDDTIHIRHGQR